MTTPSFRFLLLTFLTKRSIFIIILPILVISFLLGIAYQSINLDTSFFTPGDGNYTLQLLDGLILVLIAIASGFLIMLAIKYNLEKVLRGFFVFSVFFSSASVFWLHGYFIELIFTDLFPWIEISMAIIGVIIGIFACMVFIFNKGNQKIKNALIAVLGIVIGSVFGVVLPLPAFLILIVLISLFDIYSVFKGPINKIFQKSNTSFNPKNVELGIKSIAIGIGDFIFYSSFVTFVTKELGYTFGISTLIGILVGIKITEQMLLKYGRFPGLPIPVFLALALLGIGWTVDKYLLSVFH
jgi:hypothetical protein